MRLVDAPAQRRRRRVVGGLAAAAAVAGAIVGAGGGDEEPSATEVRAPVATASATPAAQRMPLERQVGRLVVLRFAGTAAPAYVLRALREGRVSGVILFRENLTDQAGLKRMTGRMERAAGGPVIVCVDQEGGGVRVIPWVGPAKAAPAQASAGTVERDARAAAKQMKAAGVTVTLAPVADLPTVDGAAVGGRTFGRDPDAVQRAVRAATTGWRAGGVAPTLKHFPGLGGAKTNTDDAPVTIDRSAAQLRAVDLPPFRAGIEAGAPIVMLSHARYPAIDRGRIASQSPQTMRLLREELDFEGVVMTDSLEAAAVTAEPGGVGRAAIRSVEAGVDSILTTGRGSYIRIYRALLARAKKDPAFRARVGESAARVEALLQQLGER